MSNDTNTIKLDPLQVQVALTSNGRRVTPEDIKAATASVRFFTAADGVYGAYKRNDDVHPTGGTPGDAEHTALSLLTICVLVLRNGFTVVGTSACADPANFNREIGQEIALRDAERQVWPLLGFELKNRMAADSNPAT